VFSLSDRLLSQFTLSCALLRLLPQIPLVQHTLQHGDGPKSRKSMKHTKQNSFKMVSVVHLVFGLKDAVETVGIAVDWFNDKTGKCWNFQI
jgi:hypothetical protein